MAERIASEKVYREHYEATQAAGSKARLRKETLKTAFMRDIERHKER
jgi:hypothetical protein